MTLYIKCLDNNLEELYKKYFNDRNNSYDKSASGFNTICVNEQVIPANSFGNLVKLGIICRPSEDHGYYILLRSSTGKNTKLRLSNHIGLIDLNYRGEIGALIDNFDDKDYVIKTGERLVQLVFPNAKPFNVELVNEIDETDRGSNGFGSTGTGL